MNIFVGPRTFQVWAYTVSSSRLLLRSTKSEEEPTRVDLYFHHVAAFKARSVMRVGRILEAESERASQVRQEAGLPTDDGRTCFVLESFEGDGYVVADLYRLSEDSSAFYAPNPFWDGDYSGPRIRRLPEGDPGGNHDWPGSREGG